MPRKGACGFDTLGSSLFMSSDQFEQYLAVGRKAVADAMARWRQLYTPPARKSERTEVEIAARRQMGGLLNGYFLDGYRRAKAWQAAGGEPTKAKEFGFPDVHEAKFRIEEYERNGPYIGAYLAMPKSEAGAWLTYSTNNYHYQENISIPADAPPGHYLLRARVGFNDKVPSARRFLEFGIATRTGETDEFQVLDTFQVTGSIHAPMTLEIPVTVTPDGPRRFSLREKRHATADSEFFRNTLARAQNGVGLDLALWIDWVEWDGPVPDTAAAAASGTLRTPEGLAAQTARLIADRRSFDFAQGFTHQWLDVDRLDFFRFDHQLYPEFDESTREAAKGEIYHTFHTLLAENLDARKLLKNDFVVINGLLATYYGLDDAGKPIQGMHYRKVAVPAASPRGGLLGMAAVLGMGSNGERTSQVERGAWVLRKLLNDPPPPAPPNVPQLSRLDSQKITARERMRMHQEEPQCAQCHRVIDPIGFGLENFDAAGRWRTEEHAYGFNWVVKGGPAGKVIAASFPIDPAGAFHNGLAFKDFFELRDLIAARGDDFLRGLIENLYAYALGRPVSFADTDAIDGLVAQAKANGGGLASIIQSIVATPEFRTK